MAHEKNKSQTIKTLQSLSVWSNQRVIISPEFEEERTPYPTQTRQVIGTQTGPKIPDPIECKFLI